MPRRVPGRGGSVLGRLTRSRVTSAAIATAVNAAILYLLIVLGFQRLEPVAPATPEIKVNLIHRDVKPFWVRPQLKVRPALALIRTPLALRLPEIRIKAPAQFMVRAKSVVAMTGSTVPGGAHGAFDGRVALRFAHFVAPSYPAKLQHQGNVRLAVVVASSGEVEGVKVLRTSGSRQLDRAAVTAARQWRFAPFRGAPDARILTVVNLHFVKQVKGSFLLVHYGDVARQISAEIERRGYPPSNMLAIWRRLLKFIDALPGSGKRGGRGWDASETELVGLGRVQSVRFVGFIPHGLQHASRKGRRRPRRARSRRSRWQVYRVTQQRGFSEWLVEVTPHGTLRRIEAAIHVARQHAAASITRR